MGTGMIAAAPPGATATSRRADVVHQLSDRLMAADILKDYKYLASCATMAAMETNAHDLRGTFIEHAREDLNMAEELYRIMRQRGWYPDPPRAGAEQVHWAAEHSRQMLEGMRGRAPGAQGGAWAGFGAAQRTPGGPGGGPAGATVGPWGGTAYDPRPHAGGPGYWNPGAER